MSMCNPKHERDAWLMLVTLQEIPLAVLNRLEEEVDPSKSLKRMTNIERGRYTAQMVIRFLKEIHAEVQQAWSKA